MKIMHEHIAFQGRSAIKVKLQEKPHFTYPWHFHSEFELLYVLKGYGNSFVANNIEKFGTDDFVLLGSNLPHFWKTDESYHHNDSEKNIQYLVIQFSDTFFNQALISYPEFQKIRALFNRSAKGVRFSKGFAKRMKEQLLSLVELEGFERMIILLQILQKMAKTKEYHLLASELYQADKFNYTSDRLTKVMHYLNSNYLNKVDLETVAEVAHMHPSSFCRYFKEKTEKSLSEFVNEMRINYACRLVIEGQMNISQVCFESGFNNLSNFNRTFKKHTGITPKNYRLEIEKSE